MIALGVLNVVLGAIGIALPVLPTTPFLLLAAYLFARSSERWHKWLLSHKHLGPYIHAFKNKSGLTVAQKVRIGSSFTIVIAASIYFSPITTIRILLVAGWLFWTIQLLRIKTVSAGATSSLPKNRLE